MGDLITGDTVPIFTRQGIVLAFVSSVGDLVSTLPCWEWFSFGDSRGLLGEQSGCVRGQSVSVGGVGFC